MKVFVIRQFVSGKLKNEELFFTKRSAEKAFLEISQITSLLSANNAYCNVDDLKVDDFKNFEDDRTVEYSFNNLVIAKVTMCVKKVKF